MSSEPTPRISRRAILDRAKNAGVAGRAALLDVAFTQLLARATSDSPGQFMVKGAQALRAHLVSNRATDDLDMRSDAETLGEAIASLQRAARIDLGDGVAFQALREPTPLGAAETGDTSGVRPRFEALLDGAHLAHVSIDLVVGRGPCAFGHGQAPRQGATRRGARHRIGCRSGVSDRGPHRRQGVGHLVALW